MNDSKLPQVDVQTLVGLFAATGIPALVKAVIGWIHPSLVVLLCPPLQQTLQTSCYADERWEAGITLGITALGVGYMLYTMYWRLKLNSTPPVGTTVAIIPKDTVPVTAPQTIQGLSVATIDPTLAPLKQTSISPVPPGKSL